MITDINVNRMIYGVTLDVTPTCQNYGGRRTGDFYVVDGKGGTTLARPVYVYDDIMCCIVQYISLHDSAIYDITGVCNPGGRDIYLSANYTQVNGRALKESVVFQTTADSEGNFCFRSVSGLSGECAVWSNVPPDLLQSSTMTLDYTIVETVSDPVLVFDTFETSNVGKKACTCCAGEKIVTSGEACSYCGGDGVLENIIECPTCSGAGTLADGSSCTECGGDGKVNETCNVCMGTKTIPTIICRTCNAGVLTDGSTCPDCGGSGTLTTYTCPICSGTGQVSAVFSSPLFTIQGTCPSDVTTVYATVYKDGQTSTTNINTIPADNEITLDMLRQAHSVSSTPTDGAFTIEVDSGTYSGVPNGSKCVVWATTVATNGSLAIDSVSVSESPCLSGDTMISITTEVSKRLDMLKIGDIVMAGDGTPTRVRQLKRGLFNHYHTLYTFEDGTVIDETHTHRFYNSDQGFWQRLGNWNIGDHALRQDGKYVALVGKECIQEKAEMFGIWTDSGDYYANGLLSGAVLCNKALLENATAEQAIDMLLSASEYQITQMFGLEGVLP